ncbi:MAG: Uma2 family endonuclease [Bryobacteraceae bacterium]
MGTKALMSVEEYLNTEFEEADCEYVDGEIIERNMGQSRHSWIQTWLIYLFMTMPNRAEIQARVELRIKIAERRYRIPDVSVWRKKADLSDPIPTTAPFLAIEILSPTDRSIETLQKIREYLGAGIEWIWVIDPYEGRAMVYSHQNPLGESVTVLRTEDPTIELPLERILNPEI